MLFDHGCAPFQGQAEPTFKKKKPTQERVKTCQQNALIFERKHTSTNDLTERTLYVHAQIRTRLIVLQDAVIVFPSTLHLSFDKRFSTQMLFIEIGE